MVRNILAPVTPSPLAPASAKTITPSPVPRQRNAQGYAAGASPCDKENVAFNVLPTRAEKKLAPLLPLPDSWVQVPASLMPTKHGFIHFEDLASPRRRTRKSEPWSQKIEAGFDMKDSTAPSIPQTPECFSPRPSTESAQSTQGGTASGRRISISDALFSGSSATPAVPRPSPGPGNVLRISEHLPPAPASPAQLPPRQLSFLGVSPMQGKLMWPA
eukprot:TRINITY_DN13313_c0_g1_i2.p1 TRINITY_DN13313_c0_g1~~TRINITY_DN13313_c0_g1_i2.p1  ORF type:complete len:216 (+),score=23.03 TRINITY_DN13313_c0_g1_i2:101-748(+)